MARKAKAISTTTSTNSIMPSDNLDPAATAPLALSQEASTPVQATASNITKKKKTSKKRSTAGPVTTTPSDPNNATALLARVAEQQAEIDRLRKATQSMAQATKPKEIQRPLGTINNLQKAMGLENDRALYMTCRATINDALAHAGIPLGVDWRHQDFISLGKVASVAKSRNKQLQNYESNWASLEIMKTIIKNKRNYRSKIGRLDTNNQEPPDQTQSSGSQQAGALGISDGASDENELEGFSDSDIDEGNKENGDPEGDGSGAGSAGKKRKATGSGGSGGKGKQRKL